MITFGPGQRYWLYRKPTDMRKSFDGLCGLVASGMKRDPLSGEVFVFINRRRTHIKLLVWDRSGFVLYYKRLEEGTFEIPGPEHPLEDILGDLPADGAVLDESQETRQEARGEG